MYKDCPFMIDAKEKYSSRIIAYRWHQRFALMWPWTPWISMHQSCVNIWLLTAHIDISCFGKLALSTQWWRKPGTCESVVTDNFSHVGTAYIWGPNLFITLTTCVLAPGGTKPFRGTLLNEKLWLRSRGSERARFSLMAHVTSSKVLRESHKISQNFKD